MKQKILWVLMALLILANCKSKSKETEPTASDTTRFNIETDLLLVQYDCKTDVDDLHSIAGFMTLLQDPKFSKINYHAVAGTYGVQEGLYVPPNELFQLAFGNNWTDAHNNIPAAVEKVVPIAKSALSNKGDIWIAEAGQSDFSAALVKALQQDASQPDIGDRIHLVQHSNWNEEVTDPKALEFVKQTIDYHKIPDGNSVGNGTPGFRTPEYTRWRDQLKDPDLVKIWELAVVLGNKYNGVDGRYLNAAIASNGLDFSDLSEVCWILEIADIKDTAHFFDRFVAKNP